MVFSTIPGGFDFTADELMLINKQRAITKHVNDAFIQVGAVFLKASGKNPIADDWAMRQPKETNLQDWIDDEGLRFHNAGFNLQFGWMDIDIDAEDPYFNECMVAALDYNGVDTRFRFGRRSVGRPTHVLVQLGEEEAANFDDLSRFEPREFRIDGKRYHTQLRSYPTNLADKKNLARSAKQTVMPGSVYLSKVNEGQYDLSVWYHGNTVAENVRQLAATTPRRVNFNQVLRSIAFATFIYVLRDHWVEGSRQTTATRVAGWLARVVKDSEAMNNHETIAKDVFCPVDTDDIAESLLSFACDWYGDDEKHMRIRTYNDAREKLDRNPDAKIPGWPALTALIGAASVAAIRTVFTPGSDVSVLTKLAERYLYDETDNAYIDRDRHRNNHSVYVHDAASLERRHIDETVSINGKPRAAFYMFETSKMRSKVAGRGLYPDLDPGLVFRLNGKGQIIGDDTPDETASPVFNTWRGWPIAPVDHGMGAECEATLNILLNLITSDNKNHTEWLKDWVAFTFQFPGTKQQIAPVIVGGQGVGKSVFGNTFLPAIMGELWGTASPNIIDGKFNIGPFIDKMTVFVDEAKFHNETGTDEVKKLIRNVNMPGMLKYGEGGTFRIYSRLVFASNHFDMSIGQSSVIDRALFYIKSWDSKSKGMTDTQFRAWTETLKPWFSQFHAWLERMDVREQFVHMMMHRKVTKDEIESITLSASKDPDIIQANIRPSRRFAKYILEEGRIHEDLGLETPFNMAQLANRIGEIAEVLHVRPVRTDLVLAEFQELGLIARSGMNFYFVLKHETLIDAFVAATSVPVEKNYEFTEADRGENKPDARTPWKGQKMRGKF